MSLIQVVSASAGSGKTYRLVQELEQAITAVHAPVRPEAVIATTFTVKAAAELRERVRGRLLEQGLVAEAQQLAVARIGTVHSMCAELISEFAFELGLSPELRTLDDTAAKTAFERALSGLLGATVNTDEAGAGGSDAALALHELEDRLPGLDWQRRVRDIVALARANRLDGAALRRDAARSVASLSVYLPAPAADGAALEGRLRAELEAFVARLDIDSTKKTKEVLDLCERVLSELRRGRALPWTDWAKLAAADPAVKLKPGYAPVADAARAGEGHPALRADLEVAITQVFELAAQALEAYQAYKLEWGLLDFVDQERLALELLHRPHVRELLAEQLDLVLVDEFQDTNPLQLELFLALSTLAPRSVWVGDQKQAIYGFRGTDPSLMEATVAAIAARGEAGAFDTLPYSWRSRAPLVHLTSAIFAQAFEAQGVPAERVRLLPAEGVPESDGLGPVAEVWSLQAKTVGEQAAAVAAGVVELMTDAQVRVRDTVTGASRRVRPADIAVLCRNNIDLARLASALEALGVPAVLGREGLVATLEARVMLAGLRLWVDPRDRFAAAELGRLVGLPHDPEAWLLQVLDSEGRPLEEQPEVVRVVAARGAQPTAGVLLAFDAVLGAIGARELCLRWGQSAQRLANIDSLRALALKYTDECMAERETPTVAGLVAYLQTLAGEKRDMQATPGGQDAVTLSTLWGAKGLEWPVTILFAIDRSREPSAFGVHLMSGTDPFSFDSPLAGRWIRYWPDAHVSRPTGFGSSGAGRGTTSIHSAVRNSTEHQDVQSRETHENLRLLYVGWTRARDRVVLASRDGKLLASGFETITALDGVPLLAEPDSDGTTEWGGHPLVAKLRSPAPSEAVPQSIAADEGYVEQGPREFAAAWLNPSRLSGAGVLGEPESLGGALPLAPEAGGTALGDACHAFFAADASGLPEAERSALAAAVLQAHATGDVMSAADLALAGARLRDWTQRRWPGAKWHREWPLQHRLPDGSVLRGYADLVLETATGLILVDHKCLGGTHEEALATAAGYGGQLAAYAAALEAATGSIVHERWLHLVLQGECVRVG